MKFGGTSVADAERIRAVGQIVRDRLSRRPVIVVSALAGVTDLLERAISAARGDDLEELEPIVADLERRHRWALAGTVDDSGRRHRLSLEIDRLLEELRQMLRSVRILREGTPRAADAILAMGETLSARILSEALDGFGLPSTYVDPRSVLITDDAFGHAEPDLYTVSARCRERVLPELVAERVPVLGGFVGATEDGRTTTLGRGGSDTSAAVLGSALQAEEIQIWTDVDGLMTADPGFVPEARPIPRVSFTEAAELAFYGARVLHPDSLAPAVRRGIPVRITNSLKPSNPGTVILEHVARPDAHAVVSVASRGGVSTLSVNNRRLRADPEFAAGVLEALRSSHRAPDLVVASEIGVHLVLREDRDTVELERELDRLGTVARVDERAIVCVVGSGLAEGPIRRRAIEAVAAWEPELVGVGSTGASIAAVVPLARLAETVRGLHREFFEEVAMP